MFTVYLPRVDDSVQAVKTSSGEISSVGGSETIMVVEDEEDVREMICNLLRSQGYSVLAAENGADALQVWERHEDPVHMLLTDVVMPSMGGPELADWLAPLRAQMKVVFISGTRETMRCRTSWQSRISLFYPNRSRVLHC